MSNYFSDRHQINSPLRFFTDSSTDVEGRSPQHTSDVRNRHVEAVQPVEESYLSS
ncbi:MAG: hypothetical protein KME45_06500 [Stenomitos rutilans HA7619-LM2]|nr:hypothetical protein [Stenomitos rutilans HA7619-LM2]